jgi:hypothetical protein
LTLFKILHSRAPPRQKRCSRGPKIMRALNRRQIVDIMRY